MPIEIEVKKPLEVPEGAHKGEVTKVEERTEPYHYIDIFVTCDGFEGGELKYGSPARLTSKTKLGRTIGNFVDLNEVMGQKVDLEKILVGQKVQYVTVNEVKEQGTFAMIVDGSLKPVPNQPTPETDAAKKELADNAATIKQSE